MCVCVRCDDDDDANDVTSSTWVMKDGASFAIYGIKPQSRTTHGESLSHVCVCVCSIPNTSQDDISYPPALSVYVKILPTRPQPLNGHKPQHRQGMSPLEVKVDPLEGSFSSN